MGNVKKNLFIVQSPFQLISAIEARDYFKSEYAILILQYSGKQHKNSALQMQQLINQFNNFDEVIEIQPVSGVLESNLRLLFILKMLQLKSIEFGKIFIGEYRSWYHTFFWNVLVSEEDFVLDDGSVIIELQKNYIPTRKYYDISTGIKRKLKLFFFKLISMLFIDSKDHFHRDIHLFTCFDLAPYHPNQRVIKNNFSVIKKLSKTKSVDESKIYFFGACLSELNILSRNQEFAALEKVNNYYKSKNKELIYISHRRETGEKLDLLWQMFDLSVLSFSNPAEIQFLLMDSLPFGIASFYSTALFTVSKMFNFNSVESFLLPVDLIPQAYRKNIISVYAEYKKFMTVMDLNEISTE
ncbi:MAG: hypothetical protein WCK35_26265 [Chloroflexota bacterium]